VPAGKAADRAVVELFDELRFPDTRIEDLRQRCRRGDLMQK
jgi:hypothetical protein